MGKVDFYPIGTIEHFQYHINYWPKGIKIIEVSLNDKIYLENKWQILIRIKTKNIILIDIENEKIIKEKKILTKEEFILILKNYKDTDFIIYRKISENNLIGYLLDFFEYYVNMPEKIKDIEDEDIILK